ncbi:MAG: hypothetical protein P1U41_00655 [Vicingaceae bacterium]|nr:hypothetical protein [Vicingaceae bacterium]
MTEILMCTILVLSLYCYLKENFILGTLILSFSLLARPESNIVIPFFMLYLLYKKQFIALPFILSGFIIFSFAGYFYYDNFFWIITERPYFSKGTYGTGSFFHFILGYKQILGLVATFLFVLGMISLFIKKQYEEKKVALFLLVLFPAISVLLVHSFLWWTSLYTSAGYFRVLSTVIPLFALISFLGLNTMFTWLEKRINKTYINILTLIISALIVFGGLFNLQIDNRLMIEQDVLIKAANWYKSQGENKKIYYLPPSFSYQARINPFTEEGTRDNMKYFGDKDKPSRNMKEGELLLWDGQYSRVEGQISLEDCLKDDNLLCVSSFYPKENITFYGHPYSVRIFKKVNKKVEVKNSFVNEFNKSIKSVLKTLRVENNSDEFLGLFHVDNKTSHRGVVLQYDFSCKIRLPAEYENKKLKLVYTWETLGEGVFYDSKNVEIKDGGGLLDFQFISNSSCFQNAEFRVYFWNINKYPISLSDIEFSVKAF